MPTFGTPRRNRHAGKDLKNRPLRHVLSHEFSSEELELALRCLRKAHDEVRLTTPDGRHATHVREWQRQCEQAGLEKPGKFRALSIAAKSQGVTVDGDGFVHWGTFSNGRPE